MADLDDAGWSTVAESPIGHVPIRLLVLHALWDSWIHERDIAIPLGLSVVEDPDEVSAALTYGTALGPAFLASGGSTRRGSLALVGTDPHVRVVIDMGTTAVVHDRPAPADAVTLAGPAVDLLEAVSYRMPLDPFVAPSDRWMLDGLAAAFDIGPDVDTVA